MKGDSPALNEKSVPKNVKMSANRINKCTLYLNQRPVLLYTVLYIRRDYPKHCNRNIFPGNNLGFKIPSKYTFKNSRGFCELWAHTHLGLGKRRYSGFDEACSAG